MGVRSRLVKRARGRRLMLGAVGAGLLAVGTGGAMALAGASVQEAGPERQQQAAEAVDARLGDAFALFRSSRLQVASGGAEGGSQDGGARPFGQSPALSRAVAVPRGGSVFVIPGNDAVCLGDQVNYGHTCVPVEEAVDGYLYLITLGDPREPYTSVTGLAPDGVAHATVELASGRRVRVPVRHNVYDVKLGAASAVAEISWTSSTGGAFSQAFPDGGIQRPELSEQDVARLKEQLRR